MNRPSLVTQALTSISILLCLTVVSYPIALDGTFGTGGRFNTAFATTGNPSSSGRWIHIQPSGRIVIVGGHTQQGTSGNVNGIAIAGLTSAGILDNGFGSAGKILIWTADVNQPVTDSVSNPDGSFFVLHHFQHPASTRSVLLKFTSNGQPDASFSANLDTGSPTVPFKIAVAADGKIYAMIRQAVNDVKLIRLNSNGSRDASFGPDGIRNLNLNRIPSSDRTFAGLHVLADGKLVITGSFYQNFDGYSFAMRFDSDTNLDRSFGTQGVFRMSMPNGSVGFRRSLIQPDGKLIMGGFFTFLGSNALLIRLTIRGKYDGTFGSAGIAMTSFNNINVINGMALAPDGRIVIAGVAGDKSLPANNRMFVSRFSSAGVRESFLLTNFIGTREAGGTDVALQTDGKMVASGFTQNESDNFLQLAAARFVP